MRGYVQEDLLEARRRTVLHSRVKKPATQDDIMRGYDGHLHLSEDAHAETLPQGGALGWLLAILSGLAATVVVLWGPRVSGWIR